MDPGADRQTCIYTKGQDKDAVEIRRTTLHRDVHPGENAQNLAAWLAQKAREHHGDLSREAMVDRVQDHFWLRDMSPTWD